MIRIGRDTIGQLADLLKLRVPGQSSSQDSSASTATVAPKDAFAGQPRLIGMSGVYTGQVFPLTENFYGIGRDASACTISIPLDSQLALRHAILFEEEGDWFIADNASRTGTFLNGVRLPVEPVFVAPGGVIRVGSQEWRVEYPRAADKALLVPQSLVRNPGIVEPDIDEDEDEEIDDDLVGLEEFLAAMAGREFPGRSPRRAGPTPRKGPREAGRWLAPGEAITIQGIVLPDGMIYVGSSLESMGSYGEEPALIDPRLEIVSTAKKSSPQYSYYNDYTHLKPDTRRKYLEWLATGRKDPNLDISLVYLFFFGLERRLILPFLPVTKKLAKGLTPLKPAEAGTIRQEIARLASIYKNQSFQNHANSLLQFLSLNDLLDSGDPHAMPDPRLLGGMSRSDTTLPPLLALALSRIATSRQPLTAEWAWWWFSFDYESPPRAVGTRCPQEVRRLFAHYFPGITGKNGIKLNKLKATATISYRVANPRYYSAVTLDPRKKNPPLEPLHQVGHTPLRGIRELAYDCMSELEPFSRRVGRGPELWHTMLAVALLPDPLFVDHPATEHFRAYLDDLVKEPGRAATTPVATLIAKSRESVAADGTVSSLNDASAPLTRSDTTALLDGIDRLGFLVEPDLRVGGGNLLVGKEGTMVAALARKTDNAPLAERTPTSPTLLMVGLPLLVRAARLAGHPLDSTHLAEFALALPHAETGDRARIAARLAWLTGNVKESSRLPRPKEPALTELSGEERMVIADLLVHAAALSGAANPTAVAELIRLFAFLGFPDTEVFARLHASASAAPLASVRNGIGSGSAGRIGRSGASAGDEPLATIQTGRPGIGEFAIPKPPKAAPKKGVRVAIDHDLVKQKEVESAQIGSLLADIFTEEEAAAQKSRETTTTVVSVVSAHARPTPTGGLDPRHAAFLRALVARESWSRAEVVTLARAENLLPNAAIEAINDAAFEKFEEPVLEGEDTLYITIDLARELLL